MRTAHATRPSRTAAIALVVSAVCSLMLHTAAAHAAGPVTSDPASGRSLWTYSDLSDAGPKYEGGYASFDDTATAAYDNPHGGYDTTTNKCTVCHSVHRGQGAYYLLRADSQDDACDYCHIGGSAHSSTVVYDLNSAGKASTNGHTIGASTYVPDSTTSQWTEQLELLTVDENGDPVAETVNVRRFSDQRNDMYRFARHHGHAEATGAARRNLVPVGPLALRCMSCHQVHNADSMTWQSVSADSMNDSGAYTDAAISAYKLLRQYPSGTFVGGLDTYGQVPIGNLSIVPETTLTAGVQFDTIRAEDADPGPLALVRGATPREYNRPLWVAQQLERTSGAGPAERSDPAAVNNTALSVWCADCHNLNVGGAVPLADPELGFKAHTERTHPAPFVGAFNGPGQCYSCHRSDLPRINTGDPCSRCHYGTGNYRENRYDPAGAEYVASDFPHSGEDGDFKLLGSYSVDLAGADPSAIDDDVVVGPDNLDAVCLRCHWIGQPYHGTDDAPVSYHDVPAEYAPCASCHSAGDVTAIHASTPDGCDSCHSAPLVTTDCAECHPDMLSGHGYDVAQHTATPPDDTVLIFRQGDHEPGVMTWDGEVLVTCSSCHNTELGPLHNNDCWACHTSLVDTLEPSWAGGCQQGGCHTAIHGESDTAHLAVDDQCTECHDSAWAVTAASCANCHAVYSPGDVTPPTTTSDAQALYDGTARISFSITDGGKVGVGITYHRLDGGPIQSGSSVLITEPGAHTLEFWSVDQNGNVEAVTHTASFTVLADTTAPVTTSNAQPTYFTPAGITLTAADASTLGVRATYYTLDGGPTQTGTYIAVPQPASGTVAHTLTFWSEDWSGNVESPNTANFTITGGSGTLRLVWGDSDVSGPPGPGSEASWVVRRGSWTGTIVASGWGAYPDWDGVDDVVVPVSAQPYFVIVDWWDDTGGYWDQSVFGNIYIQTDGQLERLSY